MASLPEMSDGRFGSLKIRSWPTLISAVFALPRLRTTKSGYYKTQSVIYTALTNPISQTIDLDWRVLFLTKFQNFRMS